ncbi:MAG TPA: 3-hydroxyacyl-CoA dehydrogenase NAD-binding domain-containing protein [Pirellulales bacterium]|jgi:3-hydroxyacyl-CoA dehydrogenase/enoyl-CoA hydratase/3-hydroxybutyryl-CoA epimerase/3-hydroxyacyl-CoA dehydrogenase/enoyl-CoA hydratase/3-hydroxybutyryl-CoA epimerase/enoyl-CoA isomerase|nr:3-hydroxyacyl-CoA dehydrogenase NAD-binding domain-containing protein [Pirellulales bacterium]
MADGSTIRLSMLAGDIAALTLDAPDKGANVLSQSVLDELERHLDQLQSRVDLAGLVIRSAKPGIFVAGADLREFAAARNPTHEQTVGVASRGRKLFARLAKCPFVTVAAIDGICVGGGAELAIWCDRRIMTASPKAQFGFPEVKLGIFPGWGGTVRAPRIVGLGNAVELITGGESIDGQTALKMGLISDLVPSERLDAAALSLVRAEAKTKEYLADRERWSKPLDMDETELGFLGATASAYIQGQTKGHYPAPLAALEVLLGSAGLDADAAGEAEAEAFAGLFGTPINRALINVFFLSDRNKKDTGVEGGVKPREIRSAGVFGAGIMGAGISAAVVKRELPVTLSDAMPQALAAGVQKILEEVSYNKQTKTGDAGRMLKFAPLVNATTVDAEYKNCDLVIEAVVENPKVKGELYQRIEPLLGEHTILASNTSAISIGRLAEKLKRPDRFCGIHFFNPVRKMPLVEVIRGPQTSDETVATAVAFAKGLGKSPIVVHDGPGFLVNRLLLPYMNEALELLLDGVEIKAIESASKNFGMPMGPITLYDVVGLDTAYYAGQVMHEAFPDRVGESSLLAAMVKAGRLGQKTGVGFFVYKDKKEGRGTPDPTLAEVIKPLLRGQTRLGEQQIVERLFLPMVLEATRILAEGKVRDPRDVDLGLIYGIGFPPFKGGLLFWADTIGPAKILEMLKPYQQLGKRYQPTPMIEQMAKEGRGFYDG